MCEYHNDRKIKGSEQTSNSIREDYMRTKE